MPSEPPQFVVESAPDPDEDTTPHDEAGRVDAWRYERFIQLGFGVENAELLVQSQADWHLCAAYLARGCSFETALLILV